MLQAAQQFSKDCYESKIIPAVEEEIAKGRAEGKVLTNNVSLCQEVTRNLFGALSPEEKKKYKDKAEATAKVAKDEYEALMNGPPSVKPEDRQRLVRMVN